MKEEQYSLNPQKQKICLHACIMINDHDNDHKHHHHLDHNADGEVGLEVEALLTCQESIFPPVAKWPPTFQQGQNGFRKL